MTPVHKSLLLYIAKAVAGTVALSVIGEMFHIVDMSWVTISMLLILSPDSKEAVPLTVVRVKANLLASLATVVFLLICKDVIVAVCLALAATIMLCSLFNLMSGSRAALVAVVIIAQHSPGHYLWSTALERVVAVVSGCAFGLLLTYLFHRDLPLAASSPPQKGPSHGE